MCVYFKIWVLGLGENTHMRHCRKQKSEAVESIGSQQHNRRKDRGAGMKGEQVGRTGADGVCWNTTCLGEPSASFLYRGRCKMFTSSSPFLLVSPGILPSPQERKAPIENRMGNYRIKTDFGREERFLDDKEKIKRRMEKEKRQECRRNHL